MQELGGKVGEGGLRKHLLDGYQYGKQQRLGERYRMARQTY